MPLTIQVDNFESEDPEVAGIMCVYYTREAAEQNAQGAEVVEFELPEEGE